MPTGITSSGLMSQAECMLAALSANRRLIPPCKRPNGCRVAFVMGMRRVNPSSSTDTTSTSNGSSAVFGMSCWKSASDFKTETQRSRLFEYSNLVVIPSAPSRGKAALHGTADTLTLSSCYRMLVNPLERLSCAFVRRKYGIKNVRNHPIIDDQC
jgi:hypothetical protein